MKKILLLIVSALFVSSFAMAQVIADFKADANGFENTGWAAGMTTVVQAVDPNDAANGVLAVSFDGTKAGNGALQKTNYSATGAHILVYYVWLPLNMPDSMQLELWGQDDGNWAWTSKVYNVYEIPKGKWVPLSFYMEQYRIDTAHYKFDVNNHKIGKAGIQVNRWNETGADANWAGTFYVDNVSLVGVKPVSVANFETDVNGYSDGNWGTLVTSIAKAADPSSQSTGALKVSINSIATTFDKDPVMKGNIEGGKNIVLTHYIWLPSNTPDELNIGPFAQDENDWTWANTTYSAKDIPKGVWYPLYFNMQYAAAKDANYGIGSGKLNAAGLQFDINGKVWTGDVYVDNVVVEGTDVGVQWVLVDFQASAGGVFGYISESWAPAGTGLSNVVDPNNSNNRVLKANLNLTVAENKAAFTKSGVNIYQTEAKAYAKQATIDLYLPSDIPKGASVGFYLNGNAVANWTEVTRNLNDTDLVRGKWNTLTFPLDTMVKNGNFDTTKNVNMGVQIYYASGNVTTAWTGSVYFDNLTLIGVPAPTAVLSTPALLAKADTSAKTVFQKYYWNRLSWIDNKLGSETYNIYMSNNPITNLTAPGVVKIAGGIPHGEQQWAHRPFTTNGDTKNYYYAITATDGVTETQLTTEGKVGPISVKTSKTAKIKYVKNFATTFSLDGLDDEFTSYKANQLIPEGVSGDTTQTKLWTPTSADINFKVTLVIDDKYLYLSGDVTDDDLRTASDMQAWQGDAFEFYMGFYDTRPLVAYHPKGVQHAMGDWRIGYMATGQLALDGGAATTVAGVEATVFQKLTGDGYIVEARIALDSVAEGKKFKLSNGMMMPLKIDNNDYDPTKGDAARSMIAQWGTTGSSSEEGGGSNNDQVWTRPDSWGMMEVIDGPASVEGISALPLEYKLYDNYPNPFNPSTTIRYDLKENSNVSIKVYNVIGQLVTTLVDQQQDAGYHSVKFNAQKLASGIYIYKIEAGSFTHTKKMMLLK